MAVTDFYVTLRENSYSVANNTSSVTAKVYIKTTNSYNLLNTANGSITFGGNASGKYSFKHTFPTYATTLLYSRTFTVTHNADGSGTVTASVRFDTRVSAGVVTASKSLTLHKIPRASKPSVSGTKELGQTLTINTKRASSNYTHTIKWSWAGQSGTIGTGIGASTTWTPPVTLANNLINASSATCTLTTTTYNGSTSIGTSTVTFTLAVQSSAKPTISAKTITDLNGYYSNYGAFIAEYSKIQAVVTAASVYGATISSYKLTLGSASATSTNGTITLNEVAQTPSLATENQNLTITVTDSRGRTASSTQSVKVANYFTSTVDEITSMRWNQQTSAEDDESSTVKLTVAGAMYQVDGQGTTTGAVKIEYKNRSESTYSTFQTKTVTNAYDETFYLENLDSSNVWDIKITVTDSFGMELVYNQVIPTATPIMDFKADGTGLAFFGVSRFNGVHFNGDIILSSSDGTGGKILGFSGGETPYSILKTMPYLGDPNEIPAVVIGGDENYETMDYDRASHLDLFWQNYLGGDIGATLWWGTWSSGSVTIPNWQKYRVFLIYSGNTSSVDAPVTIAVRDFSESDECFICGIGGQAISDKNNQNIHAVLIETSGDTWTLRRNHYVTHNASGSHSAGQTRPIYSVKGLI